MINYSFSSSPNNTTKLALSFCPGTPFKCNYSHLRSELDSMEMELNRSIFFLSPASLNYGHLLEGPGKWLSRVRVALLAVIYVYFRLRLKQLAIMTVALSASLSKSPPHFRSVEIISQYWQLLIGTSDERGLGRNGRNGNGRVGVPKDTWPGIRNCHVSGEMQRKV